MYDVQCEPAKTNMKIDTMNYAAALGDEAPRTTLEKKLKWK